jgi:hypothetical protein
MRRGPAARKLGEEEGDPLVERLDVGIQARVAGGEEGACEHSRAKTSAAGARASARPELGRGWLSRVRARPD